MKDKLNDFIDKIKVKTLKPMEKIKTEDSYYDGPENANVSNIKNDDSSKIDWEKECKKLQKENDFLKSSFKNQAIDYFKSRRSIRKFNHNRKPDFKLIFDIVESGLNAPAAGNLQNYRIIVIEDEELRRQIATLAYQQYWVSEAPYLLMIVRDDVHVKSLYPDQGDLFTVQNTAAVIENILMATHMSDLASCWVAVDDNDALKNLVGIPEDRYIDAILPIGYAMEAPTVKKNPTQALVDFEKFGNKVKK